MRRDSASETSAPAFTPVPVRARKDGWFPERQRVFIARLAATRCVHRAAEAVGMSRESAYRLRARPGAESFAAAWDKIMALRVGMGSAPSLVWHRAFYGSIKPIVRDGRVVGELHRPDNRALLTIMHRLDQADRARARMRARREKAGSSR